MMRLALPHMKERPGAAVINVASISGCPAVPARSFTEAPKPLPHNGITGIQIIHNVLAR